MGKLPPNKTPHVGAAKVETPRTEVAGRAAGHGWTASIVVAADGLTAWAKLSRTAADADCAPEKLIALVRESPLRLTAEEEARLPQVAAALVEGPSEGSAVIARGRAAQAWQPVEWLIPIGISSLRDYSNETLDLHEVRQFINVRAGQALCELPPPPKEGRDVFGRPITTKPCPLRLGARVGADPKHLTRVLATEAGCVRFADGSLSVEQSFEVSGDLDYRIGNVDFWGDVTIHGNVLDGFHVKSAGNIVVDGGVGAATLEAHGTLTVKAGVNGAHKGKLVSGGSLEVHYLHMVSVECGGDVTVTVECHDSDVLAAGNVIVNRGGIIGGRVRAGGDVRAGFIGAEMCVPTTVHAGHQDVLDEQVQKDRVNLSRARALRRDVESALLESSERPGQVSRYPSLRKTRNIQLQARLADAQAAVKRALADLLSQIRSQTVVAATISAAKRIYPRVTVVIGSVAEEEVANDLDGPLQLTLDRSQLAIRHGSGRAAGRDHYPAA